MKKCVLITGANGFVGSHLCRSLQQNSYPTKQIVRNNPHSHGKHFLTIGEINGKTDWSDVLPGTDVVIHLAGKVHDFGKTTHEQQKTYTEINVEGSLNLAKQAAVQGVKRFIFMSSIKVHGEKTEHTPFAASSLPVPEDPYSKSKLAAENGLKALVRQHPMELVILRPPLIYGKGVGGNFKRLTQLVHMLPILPLGGIKNKRSLLAIENLCNLIHTCIEHPEASGGTFLASDDHDVSTPQLLMTIADKENRVITLIPVPLILLKTLCYLTGKSSELQRLTENLQVDISDTKQRLNWKPPVSFEQGIGNCFNGDTPNPREVI